MKETFIKMMRNLAYPVCIASATYNNNRYAITVSSVTSVSLDPPSLLVCINKSSSITEALRIGAQLNINFLSPGQKEIASICSSKESANKRFDNDLWDIDVNDVPFLKNSNAVASSEVVNIVEHRTHMIVILSVDRVILNDGRQPDPLLYCNGSYLNIGFSA
jgi:flavin reductase (DIM6/NTAB) family NADH-FMN oxidoreductase RutF